MAVQKICNHIKLALPKGKLLPPTSCFLQEIGLGFENYNKDTRVYRLSSSNIDDFDAKMFQEKDIPIQVSVGNYDLGICGLDWIRELTIKYSDSTLVEIADLKYEKFNIYVAAGNSIISQEIYGNNELRIVSEYPNLAEYYAMNSRLKKFKIYPVWGAAESYPPENSDLVLMKAENDANIVQQGLIPIKKILSTSTYLIANRDSLQIKNMSKIMALFSKGIESTNKPWLQHEQKHVKQWRGDVLVSDKDSVWLALPDGHQQSPTVEFLNNAGLNLDGYSKDLISSRPKSKEDWLKIKVIRPQDMPQQIANGNFDIAITGIDWLLDHLARFPSSPVAKLLDLGFGKVKIVAVISRDLPINNIIELKQYMDKHNLLPLRVASEYINIADKYLYERHISPYKVIPTWGATEVFLPEDADLLIENTQTGKTLETHNLKIIDTLFHSAACLIVNKTIINQPLKKKRIASVVKLFRKPLESKKNEIN